MSPLIQRFTLALLTTLGLVAATKAQDLVPAQESGVVSRLMDSKAKENTLKCNVFTWQPFLDFSFHYVAGFESYFSLEQFAPGEKLVEYIRVTPEGNEPVLLAKSFEAPTIPANTAGRFDPKIISALGGWFAVGEGQYTVELLVLGKRSHSFYKRWKIRTPKHGSESVPLALSPLAVQPRDTPSWDGKIDSSGLRLTVLLDTTTGRPSASKLAPWEQALLLQTLVSLLKHVPCRSVKVVAFNLDQQSEVFRHESLDPSGFDTLVGRLENLQLATVPLQALSRTAWSKFLVSLVQEQVSSNNPADAVVFVGSNMHFADKVVTPLRLNESTLSQLPRFFYFEYYRSQVRFPDAIDYLTRSLHGEVFRFDSAEQLGVAIQKMLEQIRSASRGNIG